MKLVDLTPAQVEHYTRLAASLIPTPDQTEHCLADASLRGRMDAALAPIALEQLRYTYTRLQETKYPGLSAANGEILPIDSSVDPAAREWRYYKIDHVGYADWVDATGRIAPNSATTVTEHRGPIDHFAHKWDVTIFDLETAAKAGPMFKLKSIKQDASHKAHDRFRNWTWLMGSPEKDMDGLLTHPNITRQLSAPAAGGSNSRKWSDGDKTEAEIGADVSAIVNGIWNDTLGTHMCAVVYMGPKSYQYLRDTRPAGDRFASLLEMLEARYSGDKEGQSKVEFKILNECEAEYRKNPKTGSDDSGIVGDFLLGKPVHTPDEAAFVHARKFTQHAPQEVDLTIEHLTYETIGGCKMQIPQAFIRQDFAS